MDFFRGVGRRLEIGIGDFGGFLNRKREKKQTKRKKGWECLHAFGNSWKNYGEVFFLSYIYITFRVLVCGCEICAFKSETVRKDNDIHHFLPPSILNQKKIMKLQKSSWNFQGKNQLRGDSSLDKLQWLASVLVQRYHLHYKNPRPASQRWSSERS